MQAFKVAAFAPTASWLASAVTIIPLLGIVALIGALYTLYVLYLGLPVLMSVPDDKQLPYFLVVLIAFIIITAMIMVLSALVIPAPSRGF
jgi:hypothetical protein